MAFLNILYMYNTIITRKWFKEHFEINLKLLNKAAVKCRLDNLCQVTNISAHSTFYWKIEQYFFDLQTPVESNPLSTLRDAVWNKIILTLIRNTQRSHVDLEMNIWAYLSWHYRYRFNSKISNWRWTITPYILSSNF